MRKTLSRTLRKIFGALFLTAAGASALPALPAPATAPGVRVAVVDTGIDATIDALRGRVGAVKDFTDPVSWYVRPRHDADHGTLVAGVVARTAPGVVLIDAKVIGNGCTHERVAAAIRWAADRSDVVNCSIHNDFPDDGVKAACDYAWEKGVIVVAAASNEGPGEFTTGYPAGYDGVVTVGALERDRRTPADFSSRGPNVFCAGPGVRVICPKPGGGTREVSGTSLAAPWVAGLAAAWVASPEGQRIVKADRPAAFIKKLRASCTDLHTPGWDSATGHGLPDLGKVVR